MVNHLDFDFNRFFPNAHDGMRNGAVLGFALGGITYGALLSAFGIYNTIHVIGGNSSGKSNWYADSFLMYSISVIAVPAAVFGSVGAIMGLCNEILFSGSDEIDNDALNV